MQILTPEQAKASYDECIDTLRDQIADVITRRIVANYKTIERKNGSIIIEVRRELFGDNYKSAMVKPIVPEDLIDEVIEAFNKTGWDIKKEQKLPYTIIRVRKADNESD